MAARNQDAQRFYVYDILDESGQVIYVGKGSGRRVNTSLSERRGASYTIVKRFACERAAYNYEVERIAEIGPALNVAKGGNGSWAVKRRQPRKTQWEKEIDAIGTRKYAARLWLSCLSAYKNSGLPFPGDDSKVDAIREVAYG